MSQFDFGTINPNTKSGTALASDLNSFRTALHTSHSGSTAPSYITTGMLWVDSTSANLKIKMYDGAQSIDVAIIDATNNVARVAVDSAATSYITSTVAAQIKFVIASADVATMRATGLQFNIASPYIGDSSNNELLGFTTTASAVNYLAIKNAATATDPTISAAGGDTNIGITLAPKGTGGVTLTDNSTVTTVRISNTSTAASVSKSTTLQFLGSDTSGTSKEAGSIVVVPTDSGYVAASLLFFTRLANVIAEKMRISDAGALILVGSTAQKATGTTWSNPSDDRLKSNITDYPKGIAELMQVRVREWEYNGKGGTTEGMKGLGVVADEVMTVLPDTVETYDAKLNAGDADTTAIKKFDATEITWLLVKAVQEQQTMITALEARIAVLEAKA
jgi:hypothetical protein